MVVADYMTPAPRVLARGSPVSRAVALMQEHGFRHLPVVDGEELVGVVSERDLRLVTAVRGIDPDTVTVDEIMSHTPYDVSPDTPLEEAAEVMARRRYGSAVVTEGRRVVGILTTTDALRALVDAREEARRAAERADGGAAESRPVDR